MRLCYAEKPEFWENEDFVTFFDKQSKNVKFKTSNTRRNSRSKLKNVPVNPKDSLREVKFSDKFSKRVILTYSDLFYFTVQLKKPYLVTENMVSDM